MPLIDADGLFGGDRFDLVSDEARLYWPYFWCASNSVGRIELNYLKFVAKAFARFKKPLSEKKFWEIAGQYGEAFLLFVYEVNGQLWGQWDTSEKFLPTYKLSADLQSPAPIAAEIIAWKRQYISMKSAKSSVINNSKNVSDKFRIKTHGVGVGVVGGVGNKLCAPAQADAPQASKRFAALGTRFDEQTLPEAWREWACREMNWEESRAQRVFASFADYWRAAAGQRARKADWSAAWRNWCRRESEPRPTKRVSERRLPPSQQPTRSRQAEESFMTGAELIAEIEGKT